MTAISALVIGLFGSKSPLWPRMTPRSLQRLIESSAQYPRVSANDTAKADGSIVSSIARVINHAHIRLRFIFILPSLLVVGRISSVSLLTLLYRIRAKAKMKESQNCCTIRRSFVRSCSMLYDSYFVYCTIDRNLHYSSKPNTLCRLGSARCFHLRPIVTGLIPLAR